MQKREVTKKQLAVIILLSIGMLAAAALLNQFFPARVKADKRNIKTDSGYAKGDRFAVVVSDTKTDTDA